MTERKGSIGPDEARSRLYEVMRGDEPFEERVERALEIGVAYFGVDYGYVSEIDVDSGGYEVVVSTEPIDGDVPVGLTTDLSATYCRRTIAEEGVLAVEDAPEQGWADDVAYETYGLRCYHGAPITVDEGVYGTVCFAAVDARAEPFSEAEKAFTHMIAGMAGREIEQDRYRETLEERERQLDERQETYRALIDASFDLVFRIDRAGDFTYVSDSVTDLLGYDASELLGHPMTTVLSDSEAANAGWRLVERIMAGETVEEEYLPLETATGGRVYADVRGTPVYRTGVPPGERTPEDIVAIQGSAREATDRRRREHLIRVLNRVLRHNLRNDMNVVQGYADILASSLSGERAEMAELIAETAAGLTDLGETAQILERNLDAAPDPEPIDVVPLLDGAAERTGEQFPDASISIETPETVMARAAASLETAIRELLTNAAKHAAPATIDASVSADAERVTIAIADDGPGLPAQEREVLESGEETPLSHGSGLGLWLVYWIVTTLDGDVVVARADSGTRIELRLSAAG